uniref:Uncharacterized protein n=1 Tax=Alexandrium catenella TaxID=2925 RepID=A0A7S1S6I3_ALECA|mmetsp:Transcript_88185/g.234137  ORF Transcript_88185/g.234137 Transcript_88185/m.234137 type:complete len:255 (+) Transcript_88185:104-868(+)
MGGAIGINDNATQAARDKASYRFLQEIFKAKLTLGQMKDLNSKRAVIVSGPGKSPPVFNMVLELAAKHDVAVAMVYDPDLEHATASQLSWESNYATNLGRAVEAKKPLLVLLHDDKIPGNVQRLEMQFLDSKEYTYNIMTVQQFLQDFCGGSVFEGDEGVLYVGEAALQAHVGRSGMDRFEGSFHASGRAKRGVYFYASGERNLIESQDDAPLQAGNRETCRVFGADNRPSFYGTFETQPPREDGTFGPMKKVG